MAVLCVHSPSVFIRAHSCGCLCVLWFCKLQHTKLGVAESDVPCLYLSQSANCAREELFWKTFVQVYNWCCCCYCYYFIFFFSVVPNSRQKEYLFTILISMPFFDVIVCGLSEMSIIEFSLCVCKNSLFNLIQFENSLNVQLLNQTYCNKINGKAICKQIHYTQIDIWNLG